MEYAIKRGENVVFTVRPSEDSHLLRGIMNANLVNFNFVLSQPADLQRGDYITVYGENFFLKKSPAWDKDDKDGFIKFEYQSIFYSETYNLAQVSYRFYDSKNSLTKGDFTVTGTLDVFIDLLILNANRTQSGWEKGVVDAGETRTITFSNQQALEVLAILATEFKTEWWVEGKVIHMTKKGKFSGLSLAYGPGKGLYALGRRHVENTNPVTRLYVEGGTKNLRGDYRNYASRLQLPEQTGPFLEKPPMGDGVIEHSVTFDEIFPEREGTISEVIDMYTFTDRSLDFDVNDYLLPGVTPTIVFNDGPLAGYELEIASYNHALRQFQVNPNADEKALQIPSEIIQPKRGNRYALFNIEMPPAYVALAEQRLQTKGQAYLDENYGDRFVYAGEQDPIYFKRTGIQLKLGDYVKLTDTDLNVDITPRVLSFEQSLHDRYYYPQVQFAEHVTIPVEVRQYAAQEKINRTVRRLPAFNPTANPPTPAAQNPYIQKIDLNTGWQRNPFITGPAVNGIDPGTPVFWKDNAHNVHFTGEIFNNGAQPPHSPFTMPLGFRPWYEEKALCPVKLQIGLVDPFVFRIWGTMEINRDGVVSFSGVLPNGRNIQPNEVVFATLNGCRFFTGMGQG